MSGLRGFHLAQFHTGIQSLADAGEDLPAWNVERIYFDTSRKDEALDTFLEKITRHHEVEGYRPKAVVLGQEIYWNICAACAEPGDPVPPQASRLFDIDLFIDADADPWHIAVLTKPEKTRWRNS